MWCGCKVSTVQPKSALMRPGRMQFASTEKTLGYDVAWRIFDDAAHPFVEHDGGGKGVCAKMRLYRRKTWPSYS